MNQGMRREDEGFTLIELLTVVVIVGVLAAISIPALAGQRSKAYSSAMRSDLKGLVTAQASYVTDGSGFTSSTALLYAEGYRPSPKVTAHVAAGLTTFVACTKHDAVTDWMVFDSATSKITTSSVDCGGMTPP